MTNLPKIKRTCPECGKKFKPMTDAVWVHNLFMHRLLGAKHGAAQLKSDNPYMQKIRREWDQGRKKLAEDMKKRQAKSQRSNAKGKSA